MRVRNICDIDLLKYHGALVNLADTRNKIQHYEVNEEAEVLIATIISACGGRWCADWFLSVLRLEEGV